MGIVERKAIDHFPLDDGNARTPEAHNASFACLDENRKSLLSDGETGGCVADLRVWAAHAFGLPSLLVFPTLTI